MWAWVLFAETSAEQGGVVSRDTRQSRAGRGKARKTVQRIIKLMEQRGNRQPGNPAETTEWKNQFLHLIQWAGTGSSKWRGSQESSMKELVGQGK